MENVDSDLIIKTVIAVPKSRNFYYFYINDTGEKRSMRPNDLADFIAKLCPAVGGRARTMVYEYRPFYVETETETLLELEETVGEPEPRRAILFGDRKKIIKIAKEEKNKREQNGPVDKRSQTIFGNILKLVKK